MKTDDKGLRRLAMAAALAAATTFGCSGDGGGGGGGTARITGNLSSASTAAAPSAKRAWIARLGEELLGLARRAYAAVDSSLGGVAVTVHRGSSSDDDVTDDGGDFDVPGAPSGDVVVTFHRDNCDASLSLPDVAEGSTVDLRDTTLDCDSARPGKIAETFQGVILNKPSSPNGNLNVCAFGGGGNHTRAVKTNSADFIGTSFQDLQEGDLIEATGERAGNGANSTLFASSVEKVGTSGTGNCAGIPTPTPEPTETPEPTPTETPAV
jgi:hypothetical protein